MPGKRVTLRVIAEAAGHHLTTVSRALRGDPEIASETRESIRRIARELGYVPDPMLTALSAYRSLKSSPRYQATIAWVTNHFTADAWNNCSTFNLYFEGARNKAAQLGYKLEEFWLREPGMSAARATSILRARGISGLIIAPQPKAKIRVRLDWKYFSAVAMGYTTAWPQLHLVSNHHSHSMTAIVRRVRAYGYRRIGLIVDHVTDSRTDYGWTGGFLSQQQSWPDHDRIPVFHNASSADAKFHQWLKRHRPEAIISYSRLVRWLDRSGYRIPGDIGFAAYSKTPEHEDRPLSGMDENAAVTGAAAIDMLVGMIHRGERGIPEVPQRNLIEGKWIEGETLPHRYRVKKRVTSARAKSR
jgi:LacI family transcriptional regulator